MGAARTAGEGRALRACPTVGRPAAHRTQGSQPGSQRAAGQARDATTTRALAPLARGEGGRRACSRPPASLSTSAPKSRRHASCHSARAAAARASGAPRPAERRRRPARSAGDSSRAHLRRRWGGARGAVGEGWLRGRPGGGAGRACTTRASRMQRPARRAHEGARRGAPRGLLGQALTWGPRISPRAGRPPAA
jgi:hypothetical protein